MSNQVPIGPVFVENGIERRPGNVLQRLGSAWLRFSGPDKKYFSASLEDQERLRRSCVLSALFPLIVVAVLMSIPSAVLESVYWLPLLVLFSFSVLAFFCNRMAFINLSGLCIILAIDAALITLLVTLPKGIRNSSIPDLDLFLIATLIGGIVLPRRLLPLLALFHMTLIILLFTLLPHDPLLEAEIRTNQGGLVYNALSGALLLQIVGTAIAWLNSRSVDLALLRASKAEDLAATQRSLGDQVRQQVAQKDRLEYGIQVLKEAHARFANGDYRARAILQDNELASLAVSFNLLADRLNRIARDAQEQANVEQAFRQLFALQEEVVYGGNLRPLRPTGTLVDRIYPWLKQYFLFRQVYNRCGVILEKARFALMRQRAVLSQLQAVLDQVHAILRQLDTDVSRLAPMLDLIEKAQNLCTQIEEQGKFSLQGTKQLDQMLKV